ncbi:MAG: hypothetical protein AAFO29_18535, partial [Actinomycetota bacterium]
MSARPDQNGPPLNSPDADPTLAGAAAGQTPGPGPAVDAGQGDVGPIEAFPAQFATTRRFSLGVPRNLTVLDDARVLFLRSRE